MIIMNSIYCIKRYVARNHTTYPDAQKNPQAFEAVIILQALSMILNETSCQFWQRNALITENACSIGLRSGEYGGKKTSLHTSDSSMTMEELAQRNTSIE